MPQETPLLTIENHHATPPPSLTDANYIGYFANGYGEQWLLWRETATGRVFLTGGDIDWTVHEITPAWFTASFGELGSCPLVLAHDEILWITACWYTLYSTLPAAPSEDAS